MGPNFVRAGGIAALLLPVALWGGGLAAISLSSSAMPTAALRVFEVALGALSPLLIAIATAATWRPFGDAGRSTARLALVALVVALIVCVAFYAALGSIVLFTNTPGTRGLQAAGAFGYAIAFGLAVVVGALMWGQGDPGQTLWIAAGVLYFIAGILAAPSWAVLAFEIDTGDNVTVRMSRDFYSLLGVFFGTLLFLPIACICHGLALLKAARAAR